jgi:N-acetylmuramoyl-L-alanine amidase
MCERVKDKRFFARVDANMIVDLAKQCDAERVARVNHRLARALIVVCGAALSSCVTAPSGTTGTKNTSKTFTTVVVDAGHGGKDAGAFRKYGGAEKLATLDVAKRLERRLRESQLNTVMTRSSDVFISLDDRVAIENRQKNAIFVSIHFNDSRRRAIHGFETYYHAPMSHDLATRIQQKLMTLPGAADRGVHTANFRVLRYARYPAVLVECGFLSNRREGGEARDSDYRSSLADKIAEAIVEYRYGSGVYRTTAAATSSAPNLPVMIR